ncbi:hypothetical protein MOV73_000875 [Raoultella ornithinolytica]|uniref:hypothetical protein n=1 Tax=Enterobacteriaceae TaxID=543 RepID=UPI001140BC0A|nr:MULTISPECIES: hypothetical protein [Enterobacteriaceae]EKK3999255.1 hypothetical protein [Cronobacter sakazakii]EKT9521228.1 hypothetical protein [Raoultella ornithinolytica]HCR1989414.1 hypothetical protein [Enterobacter hormaechei subsp. steigerwaltii]HDT1374811.1 hypothetical protein [Enterobacter hormaechei subsp. xiangfangensis]EIS2836063.1 hypothetical protein [Escherichia coli]
MDDLYTMPVLLFFYLLVFKESVDPDSSQIEQIRHTEILQAIWLSTGNIKKEDIPKFSIYELDSLNIISNKTLAEQQAEREKKIAEQQKANMLNWMGVKPHGKQ